MNQEHLKAIIDLRHELHAHPELSLQENGTKKRLMAFIQSRTNLAVIDRGKWFYCVKRPLQKDLPPIAFRADMDALPIDEKLDLPYASKNPGVSHKCGHDGHSAALTGLALELDDMEVSRPVYLIFQHAEEIGLGARECSDLIPEKNIAEIYAFHNLSGYPQGAVVVHKGLTQPASKGLTFSFAGKTSHASYPEEGNNPSLTIAQFISFLYEALKEPTKGMRLCTVVNVNIGSKDFGVSPGEGEISCTLRAEYESEMNALEGRLRAEASRLAAGNSLSISITEADPFPETRNNDFCLDKVVSCARKIGKKVIFMEELWRASEDFGWYLKKCPGAIFYIGNGENYSSLHTAEYDFDDNNLETAVDLFKSLVFCKNTPCGGIR